MFFWSAFPFIRITVAFALGIMAAVFLPGYDQIVFVLTGLAVLFLIASFIFTKSSFLNWNWLFGLVLVITCFALGYIRLLHEQNDLIDYRKAQATEISAYRAKVLSQPIIKGKYVKAVIEISLLKDTLWKEASYKINLYVKASSILFNYGDELLVAGAPSEIKDPQNPGEFNYRRYLTFLTIYQQHFADSSKIEVVSSENGSKIMAASIRQREKFSGLLEEHMEKPKELAIAKALLLGNKDELDEDTKNTYAASGAMHVLAVSGLHVGIIYGIIFWLFSRLPKQHQKNWLIALISIPLLWGYAFITGLSPSVLRAVTLFTILAIGKSINRQTSMVNMLAVSAFILLVFNPFLLMQVGFQLSYIAVLGIIFIYPQIRKLIMPTNQVGIFFWDVTSISIAAQLATFPLSILYFHRFPTFFMVSNLVVIPAATFIVCVGIAFFTFSWFPILAAGLGTCLVLIIRFVNAVLSAIYHIPYSDLNNIFLDVPQTWMLYFLIGFLFLFAVYKTKMWAYLASISMVLLSIFIGYRWVQNNQLQQIAVYDIPYHLSIDMMQSGEVVSLMDSALVEKPDKIHFHINPNRLQYGVANNQRPSHYAFKQLTYGKAMVWNNTSIIMLEEEIAEKEPPFDIVLSNFNRVTVGFRNQAYDFEKKGALIIDSN